MATNGIASAVTLNVRLAASKAASFICNRYTGFILGFFVYSLVINLLGGMGGVLMLSDEGELVFRRQHLELTLLFYLYCYGNIILRPSRLQPWLAALPLMFAYLGQDIYFLMYSNVFRGSELAMVPELLTVLSPYMIAGLLVLVAVPLAYYIWSINYRRWWLVVIGIIPVLLLVGAAERYPERYVAAYQQVGQEIVFWSDKVSAENNGRLMMVLYREAERQTSKAKTETFRNRPEYEQKAQALAGWIRENSNNRNVHLVVLESFVDPTLFQNAKYSKDPYHPRFKKLVGNKLGLSLSPVVGGQTSQAEFEVLCGVPAFQELAGVEFNNFTGAQAYCLPGTLRLAGYQTMASNAYKPAFFNTPNAYRGIGFADMYFPREYINGGSSYISTGDTSKEMGYMFDGDLLAQNLEYITPLIKNNPSTPLFNYVLTVYGHFPHVIDETKRPQILKMLSSYKDPQLERSANQFFYRSEAVADYVEKLLAIDEKSLIILVSDHVPPGQYGRRSYQKLRYMNNQDNNVHVNRVLIIEDGKLKKYATIHHYDLPAMVLNYVTKGAYCKEQSCGFAKNKFVDDRMNRHDDYMRLMAHASE